MKILLMPASHTRNCVKVGAPGFAIEGRGAFPSLGVLYLASSLENGSATDEITVLDTQFKEFDDYKRIEQEIIRRKPDVVGIQVLTFSLIDSLTIAKIVKNVNPKIKVIFGGRHADIYPKETINYACVDMVVLGESELTFPKIIQNLDKRNNLKKIKGLLFKKADRIVMTGKPNLIQDLDSLPFPARHLINHKKYGDILRKKSNYTTMITSRGCPYKCSYCDNHQRFRKRSALNVADEMESCFNQGVEEILIYESTFTVDKKRVIKICKEMINRKLDLVWSTSTRVDCVDRELLRYLRKAGCERLQYGIEAGTQKVLNNLRKGIRIEQIEKAIRLTKEEGITAFANFIIGSPGETKADILRTLDFAKKLKLDFAAFQILMPYAGTDLYVEGLKKGVLKKDSWREFATNPKKEFIIPYWEEHFTRSELDQLLSFMYKSFYLRYGYIIKTLTKFKSLNEFKRHIKSGFKLLKS